MSNWPPQNNSESTQQGRPRIVVSRCFLGENVRYDGGHQYHPFVVEQLAPVAELIACCPEMELEMGAPREPISLVKVGHEVRLLGNRTKRDWTQ